MHELFNQQKQVVAQNPLIGFEATFKRSKF
jgi:hypothetical protein